MNTEYMYVRNYVNHDKRRSESTKHRNTEVLLEKGIKLEVQHPKNLAEKVEVNYIKN